MAIVRDRNNFAFSVGGHKVIMADGVLNIDGVEIEDNNPDDCTPLLVRRMAFDAGYFDDDSGLELIDLWDDGQDA